MANKYQKILIAKNTPKNLCFARDGEMLLVASKDDRMKGRLPKRDYFFVGIESGEPSRYGWVKTLNNPVSAKELVSLRYPTPAKQDIKNCELLLDAAGKQTDGTPMACHFLEVVAPEGKQITLKIHKVIFYKEK